MTYHGRAGSSISAVGKEVDEALGHAVGLGSLDELLEVVDMRVNTTIRHETKEVDAAGLCLGVLEGLEESGVGVERAISDGEIDTLKILEVDTTSTDGQVTDFGVTHDTIGKTHSETVSLYNRSKIIIRHSSHDGSLGLSNSVSGGSRRNTPTINDDEADFSLGLRHL